MRNPFHFNGPTQPKDFLGRRAVVEKMVNDLYDWNGDSYGIVGGRRFGKSSMLLALEKSFIKRFEEMDGGDLHVLPVYASLKAMPENSLATILGFILHRMYKITCGTKRAMLPFKDPLLELGFPEYIQSTPSPASLQDLEAYIEKVVVAAHSTIGLVRFVLLIDEIDEALNFPWTVSLFGNLRSLVYDGDMKDYVRLVLAGSGRYMDIDGQGSPLSNAITGIYLEPLAEDAARELVGRAVGIPLRVADEVIWQSGSHPFMMQYILHYLFETNIRSATIESVHGEVRRFLHDRSADLEGWWKGIGEDGRHVYSILRQSMGWFTLADVIEGASNPDLQADRGLKALCSHGLVVHDGTYQRYCINGQLFRDWAQTRCQVLNQRQMNIEGVLQTHFSPLFLVNDRTVSGFRSNTMKLTGSQYQQLNEALVDAFPTLARLAEMVQFRIEKNLYAIALGDDLQEIVFKLIRTAQAEGWTAQLIVAARESNPGNPSLLAFAQQFGLALRSPLRPELERIIRATNSFLDVSKWRTKLGQIEAQVCRLEIQSNRGMIYGTGFLLGPDVVITNYHVMEAVIEGVQGRTTNRGASAMPRDVMLRFDYKRLVDGTTLSPGTVYRLAEDDWLIDKSPMSPVDGMPEPKLQVPQPDQLDYALLHVEGTPGNDPVGEKAEPSAPPRKWIEVLAQAPDVNASAALFIVQHPQGDPLQLALETDAIIGINANKTRLSYRTNTLPGSSGSPCFNRNWELVALHHSGDPNFDPAHKPTYNEGIPFAAILDLLERRGLRGVLGHQEW